MSTMCSAGEARRAGEPAADATPTDDDCAALAGADATHPPPWTVAGDLECPDCGYNLRGRTGPVIACPERGSDNNLRRPRQWLSSDLGDEGASGRRRLPVEAAMGIFGALVSGFLTMVLVYIGGWEPRSAAESTIASIARAPSFPCRWSASPRKREPDDPADNDDDNDNNDLE